MKLAIATLPMLLARTLLALAAASTAQAGRIRLDLDVGALAAGSRPTVEAAGRRTMLDVNPGPAFAVGGGYSLTDKLELDGMAQTAAPFDLFGRSVQYTSLTVGPRYFPWGQAHVVEPWIAGQVGWYRGTETRRSLFGSRHEATEDGGGVNAGLGLDVPLGRLVSVGADLRYHQTIGVFDNPGFLTTMANVAFHFGGR